MSNRTQKSAKNMVVGMLSQVFTILLSFVSRTIFVRFLSVEYLGINGLLSNVLTVLSFAELGIGEAMTYAMYKPAKEGNHELISKLLTVYKKAYTFIAIAVGAIGVVISFFLQYIISESPDIPENLQIIFWLFIINNMASYLLAYKKSVLIAYQENYIISYVTQVTSITQQLLQMFVLVYIHQYYLYLIVQIGCTVANNVILSTVVKHRYAWIDNKISEKLPEDVSNSIFKNVKALSVSKIAGVIANGADNIIISKILGLASVGVISNYTMIINALNGILWNGLSSMTSSFGNFNVDSGLEKKRDLFDELFLCSYWLYGFLTVGIVTLINPLIELWLGNSYLVDSKVTLSLILITYISGINFPAYTYQTTLGMYDKMKYPYLMFGLLNIALSIVMGMRLGLLGIYLATSISRLCTSELASGYYVCRDGLKIPFFKYVCKYILAFVLLIINIIINHFISSFISVEGVAGFILKIVICIICCNFFYLLCFCRLKEYKRLIKRVLVLIR